MDIYYGTAPKITIPLVRAIHTAVKGRARYHVLGLHHSRPLKQYLENYLLAEEGIDHVAANPLTGNILVIFAPAQESSIIAELIERLVKRYQQGQAKIAAPKPAATRRILGAALGEHDFQRQGLEPWHLLEVEPTLVKLETSATSGLSQHLSLIHI